jgi:hypothetical protein
MYKKIFLLIFIYIFFLFLFLYTALACLIEEKGIYKWDKSEKKIGMRNVV